MTRAIAAATLILCVTLAGAALAASTDFDQPATSPEAAGDAPIDVVAADLDGDSDADLAFPNRFAARVTVLKNNGSGNFFEPASSPETVGGAPSAIAAADFDGDSDTDLATANGTSANVTILRNNGSGNFTEFGSSPEPVAAAPLEIAAADFDGDSDPDIAAVSSEFGTVTILRNNGSGGFAELGSSPETVGRDAFSIVLADLDGDGDRDLASADRMSSTVTVLKNNGSGNFFEPASSPEAAPGFPDGITAADLDGDADQDLAVAAGSFDAVTILRNNGAGNFVEPATSPGGGGGPAVRADRRRFRRRRRSGPGRREPRLRRRHDPAQQRLGRIRRRAHHPGGHGRGYGRDRRRRSRRRRGSRPRDRELRPRQRHDPPQPLSPKKPGIHPVL